MGKQGRNDNKMINLFIRLEKIVRKIELKILLGWVLFLPITAYSLGLGEIDVKSFLNQPLKAEIEVISARSGEVDDLLVGLANRAAFSRASLSRPSHLSELKFKVINKEDEGNVKVEVSTRSAVKEPVLNFLVEADWKKGRVLREFTILLDPPYFARQVSQVQAAQVEAELADTNTENNFIAQAPIAVETEQAVEFENSGQVKNGFLKGEPEAIEEPVEQQQPISSFVDNNSASAVEVQRPTQNKNTSFQTPQTIEVADGGTLWSVAKTLKTDDVSMSQVMLALQAANQQAFAQNNINSLKQGSVLRVPEVEDIKQISKRDAYVEVLEQNGLWDAYINNLGSASSSTQSAKTSNAQVSSNVADSPSQQSLKIMAVKEGTSDNASLRSEQASQQVSDLRKQLLLSEEIVESLKVENEDLSSRVKALESELAKRNELDNLVTVEDSSLAALQQNLADKTDQNDAAQAADADKLEVDDLPTQAQVEAELDSTEAPPVPDIVSTDDDMMSDDIQQQATADASLPQIQTAPPVIISEDSSASSDILESVISNPMVQAIIAGFFVLLGLLIAIPKILKKRKEKTAEKSEGTDDDTIEKAVSEDPIDTQSGIIIPNVDDEDETPINIPHMEESLPTDDFTSTLTGFEESTQIISLDDEDEEDDFSKTAILSATELNPQADAEGEVVEQDETLDEVDVYLAYSLFDNAEELLKQKLDESPERADYRAKLLETYFATKNVDGFNQEASALSSLGGTANRYWSRVQTMGYELDPDNTMYAEGQGGDASEFAHAKPEVADFDIGSDESDDGIANFDLSLDEDGTGFDIPEEPEDETLGELEFTFDEDDTIIRGADEDESGTDDDELPDDLGGLDFNLDEAVDIGDAEKSADDDADSGADNEGLEFNLDDDDLGFKETQMGFPEEQAKEEENEDEAVDSLDFEINEPSSDDAEEVDISFDSTEDESIEIEITEEDESELNDIEIGHELDTDLSEVEGDFFTEEVNPESTDINAVVNFDESTNISESTDINAIVDNDDLDLDIGMVESSEEVESLDGEDDISINELPAEGDIDLDEDAIVVDDSASEEVDASLDEDDVISFNEIEESADITDVFSTDEIEEPLDETDVISLDDIEESSDATDVFSLDDIEESSDATDVISLDGLEESSDVTDVISIDDIEEPLEDSTAVISIDDFDESGADEFESDEVEADDENLDVDLDFGLVDEIVDLDDSLLDEEDLTDIDNIEELMLPDDVDEIATKLDLAKAFIDMGDAEGARDSLEEALADGNEEQRFEAEELLKSISD